MYYIIENSDGDTLINKYSKEELLDVLEEYTNKQFLDSLPTMDTNYWNDNILIIKGEIVTPKPKEVIKTYDIK